jgi:uncharacterized membrane protein
MKRISLINIIFFLYIIKLNLIYFNTCKSRLVFTIKWILLKNMIIVFKNNKFFGNFYIIIRRLKKYNLFL